MTSAAPLVIGIDARAAAEVPAGRGRVVRELLRCLSAQREPHRFVLYAREPWREVELDERFRWELIGARDPWWHLLAARRANRECDVFLSSNSYLTIWFLRIPAVPIVYDMIAFESESHPNRRSMIIERLTLGVAVRRSALLLAISQATADGLAARFPRATGRTVVMALGVADALEQDGSQDDSELPPPGFVLAVGTLEPRKNLPRLVEAYSLLTPALQGEHPLVVVGALGWETGETLHALQALGNRAVTLGYVSDSMLRGLYRHCAVFAYPSLGEGFGLPVLEAMACGAAVITSNLSSLPEVGGDAVEYVDPRDVQELARSLESLLRSSERRRELGVLGRARAAEFSWEHTAGTALKTLERAARGV